MTGSLQSAISKLKEKTKKENYKISEESAMVQIVEVLSYYDIPVEQFEKTERTETAGESIIDRLIVFFRRGQLEVKQGGNGLEIIQTTAKGSRITYGQVSAKCKKVMDKIPSDKNYQRIYAFLGALCGEGPDVIEKLQTGGNDKGWNDLACAEILGTLFLAV